MEEGLLQHLTSPLGLASVACVVIGVAVCVVYAYPRYLRWVERSAKITDANNKLKKLWKHHETVKYHADWAKSTGETEVRRNMLDELKRTETEIRATEDLLDQLTGPQRTKGE